MKEPMCCSPWGHRESDTAEWLNGNGKMFSKRMNQDLYIAPLKRAPFQALGVCKQETPKKFRGASVKERGFPHDSEVKNLRERPVQPLAWQDPLKEEMTTHSSIVAWNILWSEEPSGLQYKRPQRVRRDWATEQTQCPREGSENLKLNRGK